jgi:hypothetical protein
MLITSLQSFVLTAAMALVVTGVAAAEGALKSVHDDWQVRCDTLPATQGEQCALTQSVIAEDKTDVWLTVSVLDIAGIFEGLPKRANTVRVFLRRPGVEESDDRHGQLLRARRERPCSRRSAEKGDETAGDETAALQLTELHLPPLVRNP